MGRREDEDAQMADCCTESLPLLMHFYTLHRMLAEKL